MVKFKNYYSSGLTITELAITITIIGLILASILGGTSLVQSAKLRKIATELTQTFTIIDQFVQEYEYLPGDLPIASTFFTSANDGNGDGNVDYGVNDTTPSDLEDLFFWEHLSASDIISGSYDGLATSQGSTRYTIGKNIKKSEAFENAGYMFRTEFTAIYNNRGHAIRLGSISTNGELFDGIVNAKDAYSIDLKIDDGKAASGILNTIKGDSLTGCINTSTSPDSYQLENRIKSCTLIYWYNKF